MTPSQEQCVVFEVPATELRNIPFGEGTTVRLIPFTFSNSLVTMLKPSEWFVVGGGLRSSAAYKVEYAEEGKKFRSIKLMLQEDEFSSLIVDAYFAASVN